MHPLSHEIEITTAAVLAAEEWAEPYSRAPKQHAEMIRQAAKLQVKVIDYLHTLSLQTNTFIDWYAYARAVIEQRQALKGSNIEAYNVDVIVNQDAVNQQDQAFIQLTFDTIATIQTLGVGSMEVERGMPIGLTSQSAIIQQLTTSQLANLVGMKVGKDGTVRPNPNPKYSIDETTRGRIANSIKTSIAQGEDQRAAAKRLEQVIADPARADMIAYTETVRAYGEGRATYAGLSGALGKHWYDSGATDVCVDNTSQGWIPLDEDFISGNENEPAHPHCKCIVGYTYDKADLE